MKHAALIALSAFALTLGLVASPLLSAAAPAPAPTPVAIPKPNFSSMMFLTGTWNCTQILRGKTRPDTSTTTVSMDGMWMVTQDSAPPFDQYRKVTINATNYLTYDPTIKQWVGIGVDTGGGYGTQYSPGWKGNTMTMSGKSFDGTTFVDVITKVSDTKTTDASTVTTAKGKVTKNMITCTKAS